MTQLYEISGSAELLLKERAIGRGTIACVACDSLPIACCDAIAYETGCDALSRGGEGSALGPA